MMLAVPAIDRFDLLEHGNGADPSDGPDWTLYICVA